VLVADPPDVIRKKFKGAVTDSGQDVRRAPDKPGVTNLIEIMAVATGEAPEAIENRYDGQGYGQFKSDVAEAVISLLEPVRLRYEELVGDPAELERLLRTGAEKAAAAAAPTLEAMYDRMGFVRP
jgi:tryptophanyl-tRNA synthetase